MLYVNVEAIVHRRPELVWDVLTDVGGATAWVEGLVEATTADDEPPRHGTALFLKRRSSKKATPVKAIGEITVWNPPALLVIETRAPDLLLLDRVSLTPTSEGTVVNVSSEIMVRGTLTGLLTRASGLLLGSGKEHPIDGVYERSVTSLIKRIETVSAAPFR